MKTILGFLMVVGGCLFGLYAGFWWGLVGGLAQLITAAATEPVAAQDVAFGIARALFCVPIGLLAFVSLALPGFVLTEWDH